MQSLSSPCFPSPFFSPLCGMSRSEIPRQKTDRDALTSTYAVMFTNFCRGIHKHLPQVHIFLSRLPNPIFVHSKARVLTKT